MTVPTTAEHPLLFRGEMVRALMEGRKTQTRRPAWRPHRTVLGAMFKPLPLITAAMRIKVGDLVWVKETFCAHWGRPEAGAIAITRGHVKQKSGAVVSPTPDDPVYAYYAAEVEVPPLAHLKWRPSIHMPRVFSRLTLAVTDVRVERLQDISDRDAKAEGAVEEFEIDVATFVHSRAPLPESTYRLGFKHLYQRIHGDDAWDANPEIVAITFTVHKQNIDAFKASVAGHGQPRQVGKPANQRGTENA